MPSLCAPIAGSVENAALPFSAHLSSDRASLEEMRQLVCSKKIRPTLPERWSQDEVINSSGREICWADTLDCQYSQRHDFLPIQFLLVGGKNLENLQFFSFPTPATMAFPAKLNSGGGGGEGQWSFWTFPAKIDSLQ